MAAGDRIKVDSAGADVLLIDDVLGNHIALEPPATPADVDGVEAVQNSDLMELDSTSGDIALLEAAAAAALNQNRLSMMQFSAVSGWHTLPKADATIPGAERQHLLDCYSGIAFAAPAGVEDFHLTFTNPSPTFARLGGAES